MPIPLGFYVATFSPSLHWCMEWHGCPACFPGVLPIIYSEPCKRAYSQSDWVLLAMFEFVAVWSHITMKCCLLWYCPNSWCHQHWCATWIDASHKCFDSMGYWSTIAFELCSKWSMLQGSCCAPPSYAASIWALTAKWRICCWSCLPKRSSLLWLSHISHAMSHSFWISADVHQQLDFLKQIWLHTSCWFCQYWDNHPLRKWSHPIRFWSPIEVKFCLCCSSWSCNHASRCANIVSHSPGSMPCSCNHFHSLSRLVVHCCHAPVVGQCIICCLSSSLALHCGHFTNDCCPHHCMFFPCANCPVICIVTHCHLCAGILLMACSSVSVSSSDS